MKQKMTRKYDKEKMLYASDDWYPNYPGDMVRVRFLMLSDGNWRVCVWGADDDGMERDFADKDEAYKVYFSLISPISHDFLKTLGFVRA